MWNHERLEEGTGRICTSPDVEVSGPKNVRSRASNFQLHLSIADTRPSKWLAGSKRDLAPNRSVCRVLWPLSQTIQAFSPLK